MVEEPSAGSQGLGRRVGVVGAVVCAVVGATLTLATAWSIPAEARRSQPRPTAREQAVAPLLRSGSLEQLARLCPGLVQDGDTALLQKLQARLLSMRPAPQSLPVVLANAEALLICQAPQAALKVLDRYGPAPGAERSAWLLLRWRAANAGLDHRTAALALQDLAGTGWSRLERLQLVVSRNADGRVITRSALDQLAGHLESLGLAQAAAEVLLTTSTPGEATARRLAQAVALLDQLPLSDQMRLLDLALDQAAASGAWVLVSELLDRQLAVPATAETEAFRARAAERRLRLSRRLDDAYGEWSMPPSPSATQKRREELERQLRSPRSPGGHAVIPTPVTPP
jgi:hypothetical protein